MDGQLIRDFQKEYEASYTPILPEQLKNYCFLSCPREELYREIFLLERPDWRMPGICKVMLCD